MIPRTEIRSALRKLWLWSAPRREAKRRAKWNGTKFYRCEACHLPTKDVEINHKVPVGVTPGSRLDFDKNASWDDVIRNLFVGPEGLEVVCKSCHAKRTKAQRAGKEPA